MGIIPWCEMCEDSGWIWSIDVVPVIPLDLVGDAIANYLLIGASSACFGLGTGTSGLSVALD